MAGYWAVAESYREQQGVLERCLGVPGRQRGAPGCVTPGCGFGRQGTGRSRTACGDRREAFLHFQAGAGGTGQRSARSEGSELEPVPFPGKRPQPDPAAGGSSHCRSENRAGGLGGGGGGGTLSWFLFICLVMKCFEGKCQLRRCCCQVLFGARGGGTRAGGVGGGTARECACFWPRGSSTVRGSPPASLPSTSGGIRRDFSWARLAGQRPFLPQVQARGR